MNINRLFVGVVLSVTLLSALPASAGVDFSKHAVTVDETMPGQFSYFEDGFSDGATVTGTFSGDDLDHNGQLSSFEGEISGFTLTFSGNSLVAGFSLKLPNLFGLVYDLDGGPIGDGVTLDVEGIGANTAAKRYAVGPGAFNRICTGTKNCAGIANFSVPEPSTWASLIVGAGLSGLVLRRRRGLSPEGVSS